MLKHQWLAGLLLLSVFIFSHTVTATETNTLRLATTTSTDNSGLLKSLLPVFTEKTGLTVHVIAVGTGKALRMGEDGDADVLLVHAPDREQAFVAAGHGVNYRLVMYNDFLIVGPETDPAGVKGETNAATALQKILETGSVFVSRGDDSGTHTKERNLWQAAELTPSGAWYREAGQGMGAVLQMAGELAAYTLTDRGTWLAYKAKSPLVELVQGDERLFNPYGVIAVNPEKYPDIRYFEAMQLIAWLTSVEGQKLISEFRLGGEPLFIPTAVKAK